MRENIILNSEFHSDWYATVLDACCLGPDLKRMEKGDMTSMAESGGVSGGQRQRIVSLLMMSDWLVTEAPRGSGPRGLCKAAYRSS